MPISKKHGGLGYDILTYVFALERIGREGNSLRTFFSAHVSIGQMVLQNWANEEQKKRYLPDTISGKSIMAFGLTEPDAGSDPGSMTTKFEESGDNFILNGKKHWVGNGTLAKVMTTYARGPDGRISAFIVDTNSKGFHAQEMKNKMGLLSIKNAEVTFENCIVPKKNLLGTKGKGLSIAYSALIDGRLSVAAGAIGVMKDCLDESIMYSKKRVQHGSALAKKQLIQEHLSTMILNVESSRWLVYRAAAARQKLHDYVENLKEKDSNWQEMLNREDKEYSTLRGKADRLAAIAKLHSTNAAFDSANRAVQIFGSFAYQKTTRVARHFLDSRAIIIYEGANEVLKLKIASLELGDKYQAY
ncbi:Glutaryl-CoA dehydrogenase [Candidatus Nitrosotalea sp. TS]|uniref:acyl-CoA dehydrogenase family protein n=1 Tax=Candidatus Nitrosotalea sp. TS TaxID=2341020 RepID=UPI00140D9686|nr:acyl-CoA dehydrogenase family protein [Candidatus Nitrosotalea sp. TS]NHI03901.1 Glutaryl-CoA dehydrogenase [Candidatus Nitrosotalea sp. TS]